jgi:hypothetical protein
MAQEIADFLHLTKSWEGRLFDRLFEGERFDAFSVIYHLPLGLKGTEGIMLISLTYFSYRLPESSAYATRAAKLRAASNERSGEQLNISRPLVHRTDQSVGIRPLI